MASTSSGTRTHTDCVLSTMPLPIGLRWRNVVIVKSITIHYLNTSLYQMTYVAIQVSYTTF